MLEPSLHPWVPPRMLLASKRRWASPVGHTNTCPCATWGGTNNTVKQTSCNVRQNLRLQPLLGEIKTFTSFEVNLMRLKFPARVFCQTTQAFDHRRLTLRPCKEVEYLQGETRRNLGPAWAPTAVLVVNCGLFQNFRWPFCHLNCVPPCLVILCTQGEGALGLSELHLFAFPSPAVSGCGVPLPFLQECAGCVPKQIWQQCTLPHW